MKNAPARLLSLLALAGLLFGSAEADATQVVMSDLNTQLIVETGPAGGGAAPWLVDQQIQMGAQWFFVHIDGQTAPVEALGGPIEFGADTNPFADPSLDTLSLRYGAGTGVFVDVNLQLRGGLPGSGVADLVETIVVHSVGDKVLKLSFFQFADFNLDGDPAGDVAELVNANTVRQQTADVVAEEIVTSAPDAFMAGELADVLAALFTGQLVQTPGPFAGANTAFALQWDIELRPGQSFIISKDKRIRVPEPASATLALLGILGLGVMGRRPAR